MSRSVTPRFLRSTLSCCLGLLALAGSLCAQPAVGEIRIFAGNFAPAGWAFCNGALLPIADYDTLFNLIGTTYGGDGQSTFALPDLQGRIPVGVGQGPGTTNVALGQASGSETQTLTVSQLPVHNHMQSMPAYAGPADTLLPSPQTVLAQAQGRYAARAYAYSAAAPNGSLQTGAGTTSGSTGGNQPFSLVPQFVAVNYIISLFGIYPNTSNNSGPQTPYMGSIGLASYQMNNGGGVQAAPCDGRLLPINQNQALFSILGTTFGGDGRVNFGLPDLRGRTAVDGGGLVGEKSGAISHTLSIAEMPAHSHALPALRASGGTANSVSPASGALAAGVNDNGEPIKAYSSQAANVQIPTLAGGNAGGNQPFALGPPSLGLIYYINLVGIFPSVN